MTVGVAGPLVDVRWLASRLDAPGLVVLDASVGAHRGVARRIPGARCFDIDGSLSDPGSPLPHTMPDADRFTEELRALGVDDTSTVVVYDAAGVYSSARAWWMLRAMGFDRAAVLDGGLPAWEAAAGAPVEDAAPARSAPVRGGFTARPRPGLLVGSGEVARALEDPAALVLDARTRGRFTGTAPEPRPGLRGGHMPGAVNLPFGDVLGGDGRMRHPAELRARFAEAATAGAGTGPGPGAGADADTGAGAGADAGAGPGAGPERLVFTCGSGVTACVLALAAELAGYRDLSVYDGSWSEWGLPSADRPVVTGAA
ncbi:sulfurtransferase [Streptomyces sp. TRM64462]|uniref:sulfurtransferase n=1 Tax=Streptomyces sp. TRM64462 TaxID=2741726 RepID=UPI0015860654|nr:sulfurtransferase [Streptomyces sp. TRM64462]